MNSYVPSGSLAAATCRVHWHGGLPGGPQMHGGWAWGLTSVGWKCSKRCKDEGGPLTVYASGRAGLTSGELTQACTAWFHTGSRQ